MFRFSNLKSIYIYILLLISFPVFGQSPEPFHIDQVNKASISSSFFYQYNSNAITNEFSKKFYNSGHIDDELKDEVSKRLSGFNRLGADLRYNIIAQIPIDTLFGKSGFSLISGFQNTEHLNLGFTDDLFKTAFYGNEPFRGDTAVFDHSNFNLFRYQSFKLGVLKKTKDNGSYSEGIVFSFIKGEQHAGFSAPSAYLYTQQDGKQMELNMKYNYQQSDSSNTGFRTFNGYGISSDIFTKISLPDSSFINLSIQDIGFILWNENSIRIKGDSTYNFSGVPFNNFSSLGDSVFNSKSPDSLSRITRSTSGKNKISTALPAFFHISYTNYLNSKFAIKGGFAYRILANYTPYFYLEGKYHFQPDFSIKLSTGYGGYGKLNIGMGLEKTFNDNFALRAGTYNMEGFILPSVTMGSSAYLSIKKYF